MVFPRIAKTCNTVACQCRFAATCREPERGLCPSHDVLFGALECNISPVISGMLSIEIFATSQRMNDWTGQTLAGEVHSQTRGAPTIVPQFEVKAFNHWQIK